MLGVVPTNELWRSCRNSGVKTVSPKFCWYLFMSVYLLWTGTMIIQSGILDWKGAKRGEEGGGGGRGEEGDGFIKQCKVMTTRMGGGGAKWGLLRVGFWRVELNGRTNWIADLRPLLHAACNCIFIVAKPHLQTPSNANSVSVMCLSIKIFQIWLERCHIQILRRTIRPPLALHKRFCTAN
jgi:hypothetical protein